MSNYDCEIMDINRALRGLAEDISDLQEEVETLQKENKNLREELNGEIENSCNMYQALIEGRTIQIITKPARPVEFNIMG